MPGVARIVGPSGCCPCGQQSGCSCAGSGNCSLQCQSKGGFGTLIGFSEFVDPSTPPRKFRRIDQSNSQTIESYGDGICSPPPTDTQTCTLEGSGEYDRLTADYSQSGSNNCGDVVFGPFFDSCGIVATTTQILSSQSAGGVSCCAVNFGLQSFHYTAVSGTVELSEEDTEQDAIDRANIPQEWSTTNCLSSPAFITQRTTGFTFEYNHVRSRVHLSGLIDHHSYDVTTFYYRRVQGSTGPWIFFSLNPQGITVQSELGHDPDNFDTAWVDIPNEPGFETRAQSCLVEDVTL